MKQVIERTNNEGKQILEFDGLTFEVVDKITLGYEIWNIGSNMPEGYLPICRLKPIQRFQGGRDIDINSLRVIKTDNAQRILHGIRSHNVKKRQLALNLLHPFMASEIEYNKLAESVK